MGPVTTNPWLIALINMTIVFGVLIVVLLVKPTGLLGKAMREKV